MVEHENTKIYFDEMMYVVFEVTTRLLNSELDPSDGSLYFSRHQDSV